MKTSLLVCALALTLGGCVTTTQSPTGMCVSNGGAKVGPGDDLPAADRDRLRASADREPEYLCQF